MSNYMKRVLITMAFSLLGLFSCRGQNNLTVNEFEAMFARDSTAQLLDVRTPEEFAEGHIGGAMNIDWKADGFAEKAQAQLATERPVMVYCRSGRRSAEALALEFASRSAEASAVLEELGFKTFNLLDGIKAWIEAGKQVTL